MKKAEAKKVETKQELIARLLKKASLSTQACCGRCHH